MTDKDFNLKFDKELQTEIIKVDKETQTELLENKIGTEVQSEGVNMSSIFTKKKYV